MRCADCDKRNTGDTIVQVRPQHGSEYLCHLCSIARDVEVEKARERERIERARRKWHQARALRAAKRRERK